MDIFPVNESLSGLVDRAVQLDTLFIDLQTTLDNFTIACGSDVLCEDSVPNTDWISVELEQVSCIMFSWCSNAYTCSAT